YVDSAADLADFVDILGRLDEHHIGAGLDVTMRALQGLFQSFDRPGVGARDDDHVLTAGVDGGFDLVHHLLDGNDLLSAEVPAALRRALVLELYGTGTCT